MDFLTHSLIGAGAARLMAPRRELIPQLTLAGILGSTLLDGDSWLYLIGENYYGKYHRVITHSAPGLVFHALLSGAIAFAILRVAPWRRFGWFAADNLPRNDEPPDRAPFVLLLAVGAIANVLHFFADVITGFGNMQLLWPISPRDFSLNLVFSFDVFIFSTTLVWHIALRRWGTNRHRDAIMTTLYLAAVIMYLMVRYFLIGNGMVTRPFW